MVKILNTAKTLQLRTVTEGTPLCVGRSIYSNILLGHEFEKHPSLLRANVSYTALTGILGMSYC